MKRHGFSLRRQTTVSQRLPKDLVPKVTTFIMGTRRLQHSKKYPSGSIGNMDETPLWLDMPDETTVHHTGDRANYYGRKSADFCVMRPRGRSKFISPDNMAGQSFTRFFEYSSASTSASSASVAVLLVTSVVAVVFCLQRNQKASESVYTFDKI